MQPEPESIQRLRRWARARNLLIRTYYDNSGRYDATKKRNKVCVTATNGFDPLVASTSAVSLASAAQGLITKLERLGVTGIPISIELRPKRMAGWRPPHG